MNHLHRELAPVSDEGWEALEQEAKSRLTTHLAARRVVDFSGPHGWSHSATNLGRVSVISGPSEGVAAAHRRVVSLVELRAEFRVSRVELDDADRGAQDLDLPELDEAARQIAVGENVTVFQGYRAAGIRGMTETTSHPPIALGDSPQRYPNAVAMATDKLRDAGIGGPYALAISPAIYEGIVQTTEHGGYLLLDHLRRILEGPLVRAPGLDGGVVASMRGGDFLIDCGEDFSIGYLDHTADVVRLYLEESFSFKVIEPDASVELRPGV